MIWLVAIKDIDFNILLPFGITAHGLFSLFSFWAMMSYLYFSVGKNENPTDNLQENEINTDTVKDKQSNECIFNSQEIVIQDNPRATMATAPSAIQPSRYSFNIFDGTDASGAFAAFIHDGDSDDERVDHEQTDHWAAVQDHI